MRCKTDQDLLLTFICIVSFDAATTIAVVIARSLSDKVCAVFTSSFAMVIISVTAVKHTVKSRIAVDYMIATTLPPPPHHHFSLRL